MARTFCLALLALAFTAAPANAGFIAFERNFDWPPTTDFQLTEDPCAQGQCEFVATVTFSYKGESLGSIPLHSPAQEAGDWDTKAYGHVDETNFAQFFWSCTTKGEHSWSAEIHKTENGTRTDYPAESGTWKQPGCSDGVPRRVTAAEAAATARKKVGFGDRTIENVRCKRGKRVGRWKCVVRWSNPSRTCADTQALFFYARKVFHRRFNKVSSFRDARRCTSA
jgi:hypothetical protein